MLCPEVVNFTTTDSTINIYCNKKPNGQKINCLNTIKNFTYNHLISVFIPDTLKVSETLTDSLNVDCDYYKITNFNLNELVEKEFIDKFIRIGNLSILSTNTRLDCDNCIAVTPNGQLILNLTKDTYQSLGLEGSVSQFHKKDKERYIVKIDLKSDTFNPGKSNYERAKLCLGKLKNFEIILTWEPPNINICPSSIAKYFHDLNYDVSLCEPSYHSYTHYSIDVPKFINRHNEHDLFIEWLGMISLESAVQKGAPDNFLTTYETPEPNILMGQVKFLQWRGFFTRKQIEKCWSELQKFRELYQKPWIAMYVQGFSDSPVAWGENEHHFYTSGDNGYIFVQDTTKCLISLHKTSDKQYYNK